MWSLCHDLSHTEAATWTNHSFYFVLRYVQKHPRDGHPCPQTSQVLTSQVLISPLVCGKAARMILLKGISGFSEFIWFGVLFVVWSRVPGIPGWTSNHSWGWPGPLIFLSILLQNWAYKHAWPLLRFFMVPGLNPGPKHTGQALYLLSHMPSPLWHNSDNMTHVPDIFSLYSEDCARTQAQPGRASLPCAQLRSFLGQLTGIIPELKTT